MSLFPFDQQNIRVNEVARRSKYAEGKRYVSYFSALKKDFKKEIQLVANNRSREGRGSKLFDLVWRAANKKKMTTQQPVSPNQGGAQFPL